MASILSFRPLLLATAGHVNHGKSALIEKLTGTNPDRLPEEKKRGMTLDLGFAHAPQFSFIDCPGHEGLVRHLIAGHKSVDGALFIVAANEGLQEQSREHARILNWLGIDRVLVVITKIDLEKDEETLKTLISKTLGELRNLFGPNTKLEGIKTSKNENVLPLINKLKEFFDVGETLLPADKTNNRFFIDRSFSIQGTGTVITGTLGEGSLFKNQNAFLWNPTKPKMKPVIIKSLRRDKTILTECKERSRLACHIDGATPTEIPRGACLIFNSDETQFTQNFKLNISWAIQTKKQFTALLQTGTLSHEVSLKLHPEGFWRARAKRPLPLKQGDRVILRLPNRIKNFGHSIGGGIILETHPKDLRNIVSKKEVAPVKEPIQPIFDKDLLQFIFENKWRAEVKRSELDRAHHLVRLGLVFNIKENQFIHRDHFEGLKAWLNQHFEKNENLSIEEARCFFGTGRKTFIKILEFCDRLHFTFRKGEARKKFKLPPYSHPAVALPRGEHEGDKPTDSRLY